MSKTVMDSLFLQNKNSDFCAPLTSFDWNEVDPNLLGTSSIDTTCTIWGLEVLIIIRIQHRPYAKMAAIKLFFVRIQNSLTKLVRDNKFFTIFVSKTRLVRLI